VAKEPTDAEFVVITPPREPLEGEVIEPPLSAEEVSARIGLLITNLIGCAIVAVFGLLAHRPVAHLVDLLFTALGWK